jgi:hypothetical protein
MARIAGRARYGRLGKFLLSIALPGLALGCMDDQLRFSARRTMNSLPDLQYQQVVENLALIASNSGHLPYLAVVGQGSIQVTDNGNSSLGLTMAPKHVTTGLLNIGASRNVTGTWVLGTITNPDKIRSMHEVYLSAVRGSIEGKAGYDWLKIGCKKDVPRHAVYVAHRGTTYVWIMPDGIAGLSDVTLTIMDIATSEDAGLARVESGKPLRGAAGPPSVPRRNFQVPQSGPVFTPGSH